MSAELTVERLRELLDYDQETGIFTWKMRRGRQGAGTSAGNINHGYIRIRIDSVAYLAHRLAWFYMTGEWPSDEVDHKDTNPSNNRWDNLRESDSVFNKQNRVRARKGSSSGLLGVSICNWGWKAGIRVNGKQKHLGTFKTPEAAHHAYITAKRALHKGCTI